LLERTFQGSNVPVSVLTNDKSFETVINGGQVTIHKLHGDVQSPDEAVITKQDYEEFARKHEILLAKLKGEMCSKNFLFLGYSFSDTNINHILTSIRLFYNGKPPQNHYCIMREISKDECKDEEEHKYKLNKQTHYIIDLQEYGISTILVKGFDEITELLAEVQRRVLLKNVLISGMCEDDAKEAKQYAREISKWLISNEFKIVTGYGKNIGAEVVAGVREGCKLTKKYVTNYSDIITINAFPPIQETLDKEEKEWYTNLREIMVAKTQITILICGNKKVNTNLVVSDGVIEEAEISETKGNLIIPIAVTGGAASEFWERMNKKKNEYTNGQDFKLLKEGKNFTDIFNAIERIINSYLNKTY
jgi:hypothetical protein